MSSNQLEGISIPIISYQHDSDRLNALKDLKEYDYLKFNDLNQIGRGAFSNVFSAVFQGKKYALKQVHSKNLHLGDKTIIRELKVLNRVDHPNVIKFYGISKADGGTLRDFLKGKQQDGIFKILWVDVIRIAMDIASGLNYMHTKDIVHRDLHSKNILIHQGKALIADFGLSKYSNEASTSSSDIHGMFAYIEPQCFIQLGKKVERGYKSDVYSLGVLFWELTSGVPPFSGVAKYSINMFIARGDREKIIPNTPQAYVDLFMKCWSSDPDKRPTFDIIFDDLNRISKTAVEIEFITNDITNTQLTSPLISPIVERDQNLEFFEEDNVFEDLISDSRSKSRSRIGTIVERDQNLELIKEDNDFGNLISDSRSRSLNNYLLEDLWKEFSKLTNIGYEFSQISEKIKEIIKNQNQEDDKIFTILNAIPNLSLNFQCLFGFFYLMGIGTDAYPDSAFENFKKVAHGNNAIGKFYLAECFRNGYGTKMDLKKVVFYHEKASEECARSVNSLGLCYLNGNGVKKNKQKAFECFRKSYENGCISACNNLGSCYELGIFTGKNKEEAFKHYKIAADCNIPSGQGNVARCYKKGIGVAKDIGLAKEWYKKAADNGHKYSEDKLNKLDNYKKNHHFFRFIR
ncbi:kinase-like domain-containing protein [Gigaspora rosea]|uniref:Kinase-like domain-containing protein n=1 Tax=Gigaspora rosea TaxID=44941 RepID=A0A397VIY7_9GLOM|nr:kinase-like domain-containing protein [Gigaspora rosea]